MGYSFNLDKKVWKNWKCCNVVGFVNINNIMGSWRTLEENLTYFLEATQNSFHVFFSEIKKHVLPCHNKSIKKVYFCVLSNFSYFVRADTHFEKLMYSFTLFDKIHVIFFIFFCDKFGEVCEFHHVFHHFPWKITRH